MISLERAQRGRPQSEEAPGRSPGGQRPALGTPVSSPIDDHLVSLVAPGGFEAEQYRSLRHALEKRSRGQGLTVIAVSSSVPGEGKTTSAINLAGALAQASEERVLLVDADLRVSSAGVRLGLEEDAPGLAEALVDPGIGLSSILRFRQPYNLTILPAGKRPDAPYELLRQPRLGEIMHEARLQFDYVVVDTPPLLPIPVSRILSRWVDGFVLVVAAHRTPRELLREALDLMEPDKVVGLVLNGDDRPLAGYYGYGHYAGYPGYGGGPRGCPKHATGHRNPGIRYCRSCSLSGGV